MTDLHVLTAVPAAPYTDGPLDGALVGPVGVCQNQDGFLSLREPVVDLGRSPYPYLAYWYWDLRPALGGVGKVGLDRRFSAHFLLSLEDGNHNVPKYIALFIHTLCRKVRKRSGCAVELDDVGFAIDDSLICGYVGFALCSSGPGPFRTCV